jgi:hypothetical protein
MNALLDISKETIEDISIEKKFEDLEESMGKVRRKLFAELGEVKKICFSLKLQNEILKNLLKEINPNKIEYSYLENGMLFDIKEPKEACG